MKKISLLFVLIFALLFFLVGCNFSSDGKLNSYTLDCHYDSASHTLSGKEEVVFYNDYDNAIDELKFFLYPNSFNEGKEAVSDSYFNRAYPTGEESFGDITIESVFCNGESLPYSINDEGSILTTSLVSEIYPDETVTVEIAFTVNLANINHRLGYGENTVNFGNFYPILCVYENGFVLNSFASNGDPFYSEVANYDVTLSFDDSFTLASTGDVVSESIDNGVKTVKISALKVRDFAFTLSENFEVVSSSVGDITVNYFYYDEENFEENLLVACEAMEYFSDLFGEYPYKTINVAKTNFCFGGMEYPNLVFISDEVADAVTYKYVIVHELAHQWWYSLVGNNEYTEAWLDESLTEYSTALFFEEYEKYGMKYTDIIDGALNSYQLFVSTYESILGDIDESMNRNLGEFSTEPEYVNCVYTKGVLMFDSIRDTLGDNKFFKCLKNYFEDYAYKISTQNDIIQSFSKSAHMDLTNFFLAWLNGEVVLGN